MQEGLDQIQGGRSCLGPLSLCASVEKIPGGLLSPYPESLHRHAQWGEGRVGGEAHLFKWWRGCQREDWWIRGSVQVVELPGRHLSGHCLPL